MAPKTALEIAANAAQGFERLECEACAQSIQKALRAAGHRGQLVELRAASRRDFMVCRSYYGGTLVITQNGRHLGVRVADVVFDNLHSDGMAYDDWLRDFDAPDGVVVHRVEEF